MENKKRKSRYTFDMFPGPSRQCAFVVCCKECRQNIAAPLETLPSSWIATRCPLCGAQRHYLPTEIFQGRISYQLVTKRSAQDGAV